MKKGKSKAVIANAGKSWFYEFKQYSGEGEERRENGVAAVEVETIDPAQMQKMMKGLGR